jgi:hypothetical protein
VSGIGEIAQNYCTAFKLLDVTIIEKKNPKKNKNNLQMITGMKLYYFLTTLLHTRQPRKLVLE